MIDPVTALATATAVFNGIKKAVEIGREAEDVFGQLGKWAGAVADIQEWMSGEQARPSIFKKITFSKSATVEAFDAYAAQVKIQEMENSLPLVPLRTVAALRKRRLHRVHPDAPEGERAA